MDMLRFIRNNSGRPPLIVIVIAALVVCLGIGGVTFSKVGRKGGHSKKPVELSAWKLEEFVVNLADRDEPRYLKANLVLEVEGKVEKAGGEGGGSADEARVRDTIITVLGTKRYGDLLSADARTRLKAELKTAINSVLEDTKVANIYFTSFAMQ